MKTLLKLVTAVVIYTLSNGYASAQTQPKFAHINMQELIVSMAEYDSAMVKMQKITKGLEQELESMNVERNKKFEEYSTKSKDWTDLVRQSREQEIQGITSRIQQFQESAQQQIEDEQTKLMQPIYEKANKAIEAVAKEQGITYVLAAQALTYKAIDAKDLLPAVKQHLGIKK